MDSRQLEYISEFKFVEYVLDESGTDGAECCRKVASGREVVFAIRSLVNVESLYLDCVRVCMRVCLCLF